MCVVSSLRSRLRDRWFSQRKIILDFDEHKIQLRSKTKTFIRQSRNDVKTKTNKRQKRFRLITTGCTNKTVFRVCTCVFTSNRLTVRVSSLDSSIDCNTFSRTYVHTSPVNANLKGATETYTYRREGHKTILLP